MLLETNHKSTCKFAEELVAYLYDEIPAGTRATFEVHLSKCVSCTEELAGFTTVRSSVLEWRIQEFDILRSPAIELPYPVEPRTPNADPVKQTVSWAQYLGGLLELPAKFYPLAVGFAAVVLLAGLGVFLIPGISHKDIAGDNKSRITNINGNPSPAGDTGNLAAVRTDSQPTVTNTGKTTALSADLDVPRNSDGRLRTTAGASKSGGSRSQRTITADDLRPPSKVQAKSTNRVKKLTLGDADEDTESLRLSDLLEEIGLR